MVVSIIGLLASIVLVALRSSREDAQYTKILLYASSLNHALGVDLVAEWNFNEGSGTAVTDATNNGNNATLYGGCTWVSSVLPPLKTAVNFCAGGTCYLGTNSSSSSLNLGGGDITIASWVKLGTAVDSGASVFYYNPPSNRQGYYNLKRDRTTNVMTLQIGSDEVNNYVVSTIPLSLSIWYFIAATYNNTTKYAKIYINGTERGSSLLQTSSINWGKASFINAGYAGGAFGGVLDDLRIYSSALSSAQIQKLYAEESERYQLTIN